MGERYSCPCCGYLTLILEPPGTFRLCPVCYWEDDPIQFDDPDYTGGANRVSLNQARENFLRFGACEEVVVSRVRKPLPEEIP